MFRFYCAQRYKFFFKIFFCVNKNLFEKLSVSAFGESASAAVFEHGVDG